MVTPSEKKLRVLVDANVLVAGVGWPRFAYEVLQHAVLHDFHLVLSPFVVEEARRHILRLFPQLISRFEGVLDASQCELLDPIPASDVVATLELARDAQDVPVVLAAIQSRIDLLISQDKDLTDKDEPVHRYVRVLLPGTFLREHMGWRSEALEAIRNRNWDDLEAETSAS